MVPLHSAMLNLAESGYDLAWGLQTFGGVSTPSKQKLSSIGNIDILDFSFIVAQ